MKNKLIRLWLCLLIGFLPLSTEARLTGEVIYRHPEKGDELWITRLEAPQRARMLFKHTHDIFEVATEKRGTRVAFVADKDAAGLGDLRFNAYIMDTMQLEKKAHNMTENQYEQVWDIDMDWRGNVLFTNHIIEGLDPPMVAGVYLIPRTELNRPVPNIIQLRKEAAQRVTGVGNSTEIVYHAVGIFLLDLSTHAILRVRRLGVLPAVSPNGKLLAFVHRFIDAGVEIEIISLETFRTVKIIDNIVGHSAFIDLKFSPDGKYLVYTISGGGFFHAKGAGYSNIAYPLDGSPSFRILDIHESGISKFDWVHRTFSVAPAKKITTLWGALKAANKR